MADEIEGQEEMEEEVLDSQESEDAKGAALDAKAVADIVAAAVSDANQKVLQRMDALEAMRAAPPAQKAPENDPGADLSDLMYTDPAKFVAEVERRATEKAMAAARGDQTAVQTYNAFMERFFQENADLKDRPNIRQLAEFVYQANPGAYNLTDPGVFKALGEGVRKFVVGYVDASGNTGSRAVMEGGSHSSPKGVKPPPKEEAVVSMAEQLQKMRSQRRKSA